jgi:hypothetical protein
MSYRDEDQVTGTGLAVATALLAIAGIAVAIAGIAVALAALFGWF